MSYKASISLPPLEVKRRDIVVEVQDDNGGGGAGRLKLSHGGAVWQGRGCPKGYRLSWGQIAKFFRENGRKGTYPR